MVHLLVKARSFSDVGSPLEFVREKSGAGATIVSGAAFALLGVTTKVVAAAGIQRDSLTNDRLLILDDVRNGGE